jgi:hypothetical protein
MLPWAICGDAGGGIKARPSTIAIPGIGSSNNPARLVGVLQRPGLCSDGLAASLGTIAAHGQSVGNFWKVSVRGLDRALASIECTLSHRMQLKASLDLAGMLSVPK